MTTTPARPRVLAAIAAAAIAALALTGCLRIPVPAPAPDGPRETRDHTVSDTVHALHLESAADVDIVLGDEPGLVLRGPAASLDRLTIEERDGALVIGSRGSALGLRGVSATLVLTALDEIVITGAGDVDAELSRPGDLSIRVDGAGDVDVDGIDAERVEVVIAGAGDVELSGRAASGEYRIDGAGEIDGEDLVLVEASVVIDGAGNVHVHATGTLRIDRGGFGDVEVTGDPRIID